MIIIKVEESQEYNYSGLLTKFEKAHENDA